MATSQLRELKSIGRGADTDAPFSLNLEESYSFKNLTENSPLAIFEEKSGFLFSITGSGKAITGFIKRSELAQVIERTRICEEIGMTYIQPALSPAYTYVFKTGGKFKGKTAASLYLNNEVTLQEFKDQGNFLAKSAKQNATYAAENNKGIEAIKDLITLIGENALEQSQVQDTRKIIHESETRYFPIAGEDGFRKGWELNIYYNIGSKSPYTMKITNCRIKVGNNNMITQREEIPGGSKEVNMTSAEWLDFVRRMDQFDKAAYEEYFRNYLQFENGKLKEARSA